MKASSTAAVRLARIVIRRTGSGYASPSMKPRSGRRTASMLSSTISESSGSITGFQKVGLSTFEPTRIIAAMFSGSGVAPIARVEFGTRRGADQHAVAHKLLHPLGAVDQDPRLLPAFGLLHVGLTFWLFFHPPAVTASTGLGFGSAARAVLPAVSVLFPSARVTACPICASGRSDPIASLLRCCWRCWVC